MNWKSPILPTYNRPNRKKYVVPFFFFFETFLCYFLWWTKREEKEELALHEGDVCLPLLCSVRRGTIRTQREACICTPKTNKMEPNPTLIEKRWQYKPRHTMKCVVAYCVDGSQHGCYTLCADRMGKNNMGDHHQQMVTTPMNSLNSSAFFFLHIV